MICAVNGVAAGAGANLAFACDITIAAEEATFVESFAKLGLIPDTSGTFFVPRLVGVQRATGMFFLGEKLSAADGEGMGADLGRGPARRVDGARAHRWRTTLADAGDARLRPHEARAERVVRELARCAAGGGGQAMHEAGRTADYEEGVRAFLAKRKPGVSRRMTAPMRGRGVVAPTGSSGVVGAGAMGAGIAQVAAVHGHAVLLADAQPAAIARARAGARAAMARDVEKGRRTRAEADAVLARITYIDGVDADGTGARSATCGLVIEAIVEKLEAKQALFRDARRDRARRRRSWPATRRRCRSPRMRRRVPASRSAWSGCTSSIRRR